MLSLDLATVLFQVVNFLILAFVLNRLLFQPVLRRAAQRKADQERMMRELAEEKQKAEALQAEYERWKAQVEDEVQQAAKEARARADQEIQDLMAEAEQEAAKIMVEAEADARRMTEQALDEFHDEMVDTVLAVSGILISRAAPTQMHDALVSGLAERVRDMGRAEMRRVEAIRRSLSEREPVAFITSAKDLTVEQQGQLAQILTSLADRRVSFELTTDPALIAGVRVRLGDTMIDNSIQGRMKDLKDQVLAHLKERATNAARV
jgi:F-type H+-transporting ATPase subunit b